LGLATWLSEISLLGPLQNCPEFRLDPANTVSLKTLEIQFFAQTDKIAHFCVTAWQLPNRILNP
jgi:hypothetical protein